MKKGSILVSDNVLQDGDIIESRFVVERRNRTIHKRMREYLYQLKHRKELITCVLPLGDGVTVSVLPEEEGKRNKSMKKPELLVPASSLEVLKVAVVFGADAVYIGGEAFGLRAKAKNFSPEEMREGIPIRPRAWGKGLCDGQHPGPQSGSSPGGRIFQTVKRDWSGRADHR